MMASGPREKVGMKSMFHLDGILCFNFRQKLFKESLEYLEYLERPKTFLYEVWHDREKSKRDFDVFGKESWI